MLTKTTGSLWIAAKFAASWKSPGLVEPSPPKAKTMFSRLTSRNRYAILHRIEAVKRPETRARKIAEFVAMLARGETVHPQTRRNKDQP